MPELGEAEIEHLRLAALVDEDVGRFDVAVDDAARVRCIEGIGDLNGEIEQPGQRNRFAVDFGLQRSAFEQLEDDERAPFVFADFVDRADVRMVQRRCGPRFTEEPLDCETIARRLGQQELERHPSAEDQILGQIDLAHAAAAKLLQNPIVRERFADHRTLTIIVPRPIRDARR